MANDGTVDQQQLQATINEAYQYVSQLIAKILAAADITDSRQLGEVAIYNTLEAVINAGQLGNAANVRSGLGLNGIGAKDGQTKEYPIAMTADPSSVPVGWYYSSDTSLPAGPGLILLERSYSGRAKMTYTRDYQQNSGWTRVFSDGAWLEWDYVVKESDFSVKSNASGYYVKYPGGLLECWGVVAENRSAAGDLKTQIVLPASFLDTNYRVSAIPYSDNSGIFQGGASAGSGYTKSQFNIVLNRTNSNNTSIFWTATGKWK